MSSYVHWIKADGTETVEETDTAPTMDAMKEYLDGWSEHVTVLYNGKRASMFVHELGRSMWRDRNPLATMIYFAASKARGVDPEDEEQEKRALEATAERLGIPLDNGHGLKLVITNVDPEPNKPVGIYGPAILLEGFTLT